MKKVVFLICVLLACDAPASEFNVRYLEPSDADLAVCQFEIRRVAPPAAPVVAVLSEEFTARRTGQPIEVLFVGNLVASVGERLDLVGTCKDEAGSRSAASNAITLTVPAPPPTPPAPPAIQACEFKLTYADGSQATVRCAIP
jgi:hypothetical protein